MEPTQPPPPRPLARRIPHVEVQHGERRVDDYFWLREKSRPDVRAYLEAENAYTAAVMQPSAALQETLYREMLGHIQETDSSAPYREGAFEHWVRTEAGLQYPIYCRRRSAITDVAAGPDEITLDLNELARGESFMALGFYVPDDAGRRLAYATDRTGFREYTLAIKDLDSGALLPERIERVTSAAWSADGQILFYTLEDDAKRSYRLYRHTLGTPPVGDTLVYEERDERFDLAVSRTRSGTYLVLTAVSHTATEAHLLEAARPEGDWRLVAARRPDHEYFLDHRGGELLVRTNDHGRNFRLVRAPVDDPGEAHWVELVPHRADVMLEEHLAFARHLVLCERAAALPCVRLLDLEGGVEHTLTFPEPAYAVSPEVNRVFETTTLRLLYESFVTPPSVLAYEMDTRVRRVLKQTPVPGYDPTRFETERLVAQAQDGTAIPISLVRATGLRRDGTAPLLLHGYGAYGFPEETHFSAARLALLERGVGYAIAHVRGGGEGGKAWHDQGRMLAKENTFTDCVTVAEHLVAAGYTSPDRLALEGRSAGGLLVGAVLNLRPDLFRAAHLGVPFLDVINTMLDETLPLTVTEFEEWGNPKKPDEYAVLRRYSPYDNLTRRAYPAILVTTSLNDSQVMFWEPAKWVAKLRRLKTDDRLLLLKMNMDAGHGGASGRYEHLRETAFEYAFLLRELGVETNGVVLAP